MARCVLPPPYSVPTAEPWPAQFELLAGVDEAGRGSLVGDVVAAAVIFEPRRQATRGLRDSKKLSPARRAVLAQEIKQYARAWSVGRASAEEIDTINILQASLLAMQRAVAALAVPPEYVVVDGNRLPCWSWPSSAIIGGDDKVAVIAAASILAKVQRDQEMLDLDREYPGYGLAQHKGYPTRAHLAALMQLGVSPIHRRSYSPVQNSLCEQGKYA